MQSVYLVLNNTCNLSCPQCIRKNNKSYQGILTEERGMYILRSLVSVFPNAGIVLTGGEPILNPNWETICKEAISLFSRVCICSNGIISNENIIKLKSLLTIGRLYIQISIDGDEDGDYIIRGNEHYKKAFFTLASFQDYDQHIVVSTTVNRKNIDSIPALVNTLNQFKFAYWKLSWSQSLDPLNDPDEIPYNDWNNFVDKIIKKCSFEVHTSHLFDMHLWDNAIETDFKSNNLAISNCGYGTQKLYIFPNGDVCPCSCDSMKYGNIFTDDISEIWQGIRPITIPRDSICSSCKYSIICNSGCPGYSIKVFGKIGYGDIRCPIVKQYYDSQH